MKIEKTLTINDVGVNGAHQAGICVPKKGGFLDFFPDLNPHTKNPRITLHFLEESGDNWKFNFIYYNNKFFGGTRNEYRLTGMTRYFNSKNLKVNDRVIFSKKNDNFFIKFEKRVESTKLILSDSWKIIDI